MTGCVFDADVVIAVLDRRDANHNEAARLVTELSDGGGDLLISAVNYAEVLVRPAEQSEALRAVVAAIRAIGLRVVPPSERIARVAATHRAAGRIALPDAFAFATAETRGATLVTFDREVRKRAVAHGIETA